MMNRGLKLLTLALAVAPGAMVFAQSWTGSYDQGLNALKAKNWPEARKQFQAAIAYRPEDISAATTLPGPVQSRKQWRGGSAYSPNFLAAYAQYRLAVEATDAKQKAGLLGLAETEFRVLLEKGQLSKGAYYLLGQTYTLQSKADQLKAMPNKFGSKFDWRIDTEGLLAEDSKAIEAAFSEPAPVSTPAPEPKKNEPKSEEKPAPKKEEPKSETKPEVKPEQKPEAKQDEPVGPVTAGRRKKTDGQTGTGTASKPVLREEIIPAESLSNYMAGNRNAGPVAVNPNKFALIIGTSKTKNAALDLPFANDDATRLRDTLVDAAGYAADHVQLVTDGSVKAILEAAQALSDQVPDGGTVFLFYAGGGANIGAKDYLATAETDSATNTATMVAKSDLFQLFMAKGARIFSFFEVSRTVAADGRYFGMEIPQFGSIAQSQATLPGDKVTSKIRGGKQVGLYADALTLVLSELRSNRIPISEFGWQVFYKVRRGDTGTTGGGSRQTPTLPVLSNLASDSRF